MLSAHGAAQPLAQWLLGQASLPAAAALICQYTDYDGRTRTCKLSARAIQGGHEGFRGTATDITGELEALAQIRYLALHDSLTGLANRGRLYDFLQAQLACATPLAVLSLDLDRFKPINDHLGHAVGDSVLRRVAQVLEQNIRGTDLVARLGGDEFVVVLPGPFGQAELQQLCERIIEQLHLPMHLDGHRVFIGVSIGAAWSGADCRHAEALLQRADIALYSAKGAGRGTWRQYSEGMNGALLERRQYETSLREAFHNDGLQICYMPRFSAGGSQLAGFEASLQWQHPQRGLLGWQEFIPGVQDPALLDALGHWILHNLCQQAATWPAPLTVSMVVLPRCFKSGLMAVQLPPALARSGLDPRRLILAIGEEVMLDPSPNIARHLHGLKALGVAVYVDKFGSRLSALQGLLGGPFDGIRFERHLIETLGQGQDQALFAAMVTLGRSLGLQVAAEGIDTQDQFEQLRAAICDQLQGAFFGQALSGPEATLRALQAP